MAHLEDSEDINLVEVWLQRNPKNWIAGILGGLVAATLATIVAGLLATTSGMEFLFPIKLMATPIVGPEATEYASGLPTLIAGALFIGFLGGFWGLVFGHFVFATRLFSLIGMGLTWAAFTWVFIWNLFLPAFRSIHNAHISPGAAFVICLAFGLGMISVAIFKELLGADRGASRTQY